MNGFVQMVARDLRLALRQRADAGMVVLFFVLTAALFPFGVGSEGNLLARIAPVILVRFQDDTCQDVSGEMVWINRF